MYVHVKWTQGKYEYEKKSQFELGNYFEYIQLM